LAVNGLGNLNSLAPSRSLFENVEAEKENKASIPFSEYLRDAIKDTNKLILEADNIATDFALGKTDNIAQVMIAAEKADMALQFTMQIRTKILDVYNEIMKMQI
jgi:flagellar hook-basal body complex protein FliE